MQTITSARSTSVNAKEDTQSTDLLKSLQDLQPVVELTLAEMSMIGGGQNIPCPV